MEDRTLWRGGDIGLGLRPHGNTVPKLYSHKKHNCIEIDQPQKYGPYDPKSETICTTQKFKGSRDRRKLNVVLVESQSVRDPRVSSR